MKPRLLLTVIAVAALAIAGAAVIILTINRPERPDSSGYSMATNVPDMPGCPNVITIYFKTDEAMLEAAPRLEDDSRLYNIVQETKAQAYDRYRVIFKDQPDLVRLARPDTLPASVTFAVATESGKQRLLAELRRTYAPADVVDPCEFTSRLPVPTTTTAR